MAFYTGSKIKLGLHACMANALLTKSQSLLLFCVSVLCFVLRQSLTLSWLAWDPCVVQSALKRAAFSCLGLLSFAVTT